MVTVRERALVDTSGPESGALQLSPRHLGEWRALSEAERQILIPEVVERWTRDLHDDDWTLDEIVSLERQRLGNLKTLRQGIELTDLEFKLLRYLQRSNGRVRTYVQIANHIWGSQDHPIRGWDLRSQDGYASSYVRHIWKLVAEIRRKLEIDPARPQHLALRRGVGYSWHDSAPSLDDGLDYAALANEVNRLRIEVRFELGGDIGSMPIARPSLYPELGPEHPSYYEGDVTDARSDPHTTHDT